MMPRGQQATSRVAEEIEMGEEDGGDGRIRALWLMGVGDRVGVKEWPQSPGLGV